MEFQDVIEGRYSCRQFTSEMPSREQIQAVLEAGRLAPTARNGQPQKVFVITKPEDLEKVDKATKCRYGAPMMVAVGFEEELAGNHSFFNPDDPIEEWSFGDQDAVSVLVHMLLKAHDLGLGTCWVGAFVEKPLHELLGIPQNIRIRALFPLGFPGEKGVPSALHTDRKPLEETVVWL